MTMRWIYREDRASQAAARLIEAAGGRISYLKLLKLLYLADRRGLAEFGRPITFDHYVSMPHGPVLSRTCDLIRGEPEPGSTSYWRQLIGTVGYDVTLLGKAPNDQLSPAEEALLDDIWGEFGKFDQWELRDYTHTLPEWEDPRGSSVPIEVTAMLLAQGLSQDEATEIIASLSAAAEVEAKLS